ncbi:methyltransferase [Saccharopolyspora sp. NPDC047091]|uniref:methyltransferase n=1 Tax=Saccharopolyspora sp. NPDC047091 TaxID=3155924 RepID=UPI0034021776
MNVSAPSPHRIMRVGMGFQESRTLLAAVELGVFTELARGPADGEELRTRLGVDQRGARDFFDALVAMGFLERSDGRYRNAPDADAYLDRAKPAYREMGGLLEMANSRLYGIWGGLAEALRTGRAQDESKTEQPGADTFGALYADPERLAQFLASMTGVSHAANRQLAARFDWSGYRTVADLGTAQGDMAVQILLANPHLDGIGFDLPAVRPVFDDYVAEAGLSERLRFVGGDFFQDEFPSADVITMGHVLHNWDLAGKRLLLEKSWRALRPGGAVILYDSMIDDGRSENVFALMMSLNMMAVTDGGFGYTTAECQEWLRAAGFSRSWSQHLIGPDSIVVGIKE